MLVAAAVCPCAPALVPSVAAGGAEVVDRIRRASIEVAAHTAAARADALWVVGPGEQLRAFEPGAGGSLRRYGIDVRFGGERLELPEALTIGAYLLGSAAESARYLSVPPDLGPADCARRGAEIATSADRVALLVLADGSARRTTTSPGPYDERAAGFDEAAFGALLAGDAATLSAIDPALAEELWFGGRAALQVLGGALGTMSPPPEIMLDCRCDPLGVGYAAVRIG
jgi:hypothetical protein